MATQAQRDAADKRKAQTLYLGQQVRVLPSPYFADTWSGYVGRVSEVDTSDAFLDDRVWVSKSRLQPVRGKG